MPQSSTVNVSGQVYYMFGLIIIAADLKSGDPVSTHSNSPTINQTTARAYASASRNVNLLDTTALFDDQDHTETTTIYFDQSTGFIVETYMKEPYFSNPNAYVEISLKATETNMWSPDLLGTLSNNQVYIIAGTIAVIAVIAAAIVLRRRKPSVPPTTQTTHTPAQVSIVSR